MDQAVDRVVADLPGVQAVYLFGSAATGRDRRDSDVDLAVLAAGRLDAARLFEVRLFLAGLLGRPVDLVDLRSASPIVARQVLAHGRPLRVLDRSAAARWAMVVPSMYEDLKISRAPIEAALRRRALHAGR